ncbi:SNF2-related, N-terminal domain [Sesbania bispinosa]|nr:SNF2-related, N-terminal domain [Sesbania bispinosa]
MPMEWAKTVIPPASFLVSLQYMQRILADAMGLGKTVMTIALILSNSGRERSENSDWESIYDSIITNKRKHVNSSCKVEGSTLIVCPMALLGQWKLTGIHNLQDELETHSKPGSISIFVHYGGSRTNSAELISGYDVVLTTYGVLSAAYKSDGENSIYHRVQWHRVVLDEAHTIKAQRSQVAQSAFALSSHCRWCLTGTPLQFIKRKNSPSGTLFMKFWEWWSKLVQRPFENGDPRAIKLVKGILRTLMLRRTKETKDRYGRPILVLPPTDIQVIECEQSETERDFYDALFARSKVMALKQRGIKAKYLGSAQKDFTIQTKVERGQFDILFMTSEKACTIPTREVILHEYPINFFLFLFILLCTCAWACVFYRDIMTFELSHESDAYGVVFFLLYLVLAVKMIMLEHVHD